MPYDPFTGQYRPDPTPQNAAQPTTATAGVDSTWRERLNQRFNNARTRGANAATNFVNADFNNPGNAVGRAGKFGVQVADTAQGFAKGLTGKTALGIGAVGAGLTTALSGGGLGETIGSGSGAAIGTAVAGKFLPQILAKGGPLGALAAGALAIGAPIVGSALAGGVGRAIDQGPGARVGAAMAAGSEANINRALNPSNTLSSIIDNSFGQMSRSQREMLGFLDAAGNNQINLQKRGLNEIAIPLLNHQSNLRAKMLPLDLAARLGQQTNQNIGQMYNTSIAGTSDLARQIAAQSVFGQVMI